MKLQASDYWLGISLCILAWLQMYAACSGDSEARVRAVYQSNFEAYPSMLKETTTQAREGQSKLYTICDPVT